MQKLLSLARSRCLTTDSIWMTDVHRGRYFLISSVSQNVFYFIFDLLFGNQNYLFSVFTYKLGNEYVLIMAQILSLFFERGKRRGGGGWFLWCFIALEFFVGSYIPPPACNVCPNLQLLLSYNVCQSSKIKHKALFFYIPIIPFPCSFPLQIFILKKIKIWKFFVKKLSWLSIYYLFLECGRLATWMDIMG